MFPAGTKVFVHSSNISGKKLGPKPHSLGFVSNANQSFINRIKDFPFSQSFIFTPLTIVFVRYGREKRERIETRNFLNVTPLFAHSKGINIHENLTEVLNILKGNELEQNAGWGIVREKTSSKYFGIVLPIKQHKPSEMAYEEIKAWATSIIRNAEFHHSLLTSTKLPTFKALYKKDSNLFTWARKATGSSEARQSLFSWASETTTNLNNLVYFLRITSNGINKRIMESSINNMELEFKQGNSIRTEQFISWFLHNIFENPAVMQRKRHIIKNYKMPSSHKEIASCMRLVISSLLNLKPKYI